MLSKAEIKAKYKALHDTLSQSYYGSTRGLSKEEFDAQHGKIWSVMEAEIKTASDYVEPEPVRDLAAELDALDQRIQDLEAEA